MGRLTPRDYLILIVVAVVVWFVSASLFGPRGERSVAATDDGKSSIPLTVVFFSDRLQATNDGSDTWRDCRAMIQGGYELNLTGDLPPGGTVTWNYADMKQGMLTIPQDEAFSRARSVTTIQCTRADGAVGRGAYTVK